MNDILDWLQNWYISQCDEDWEHQYGVRIDTMDNLGWSLTIDLYSTEIECVEFSKVKIDTEEGWLSCWVENQKFEGRCSPDNLKTILQIFKDWVGEEGYELGER